MILKVALQNHELDVAALEIWDLDKQKENLYLWLARVDGEDRAKAQKLLLDLGSSKPPSRRRSGQ